MKTTLGIAPAAERTHDVVVFIGRLRPLHNAHLMIIREALARGEIVVIIVGSAFAARGERNSFTLAEVRAMIMSCLTISEQARVYVKGVADVLYDHNIWDTAVRQAVNSVMEAHAETYRVAFDRPKIALIGHAKDHTSYYLDLFPEWDSINVPMKFLISSTDIRNALFGPNPDKSLKIGHLVPAPVLQFIADFMDTPSAEWLRKEYAANHAHRKPYEDFRIRLRDTAGYDSEIPQMTADIALIQSGHILLTRRNNFPGEGLWALPGTFLAPNESLEECAFRGLMTKTSVKLPEDILRGNIKVRASYHHPHRSSRGRIMTEAFLVQMPKVHKGSSPFPRVKAPEGGAFKPWWVSLADLKPEECFEDHYLIIMDLLRRYRGN